QGNADAFAQVIARWADQVPDVFDEKIFEPIERDALPLIQVAAHHFGFEVADAMSVDLPHWSPARRQPPRVVVSLQIADECSRTRAPLTQLRKRALQER